MKKIFILFLLSLMLAGCGSASTPSTVSSTESDGTTVTESEQGITKIVKSIPYNNLCYNNETLSMCSVDFYREQSESGHGYYPFVVVQFDFSTLSEDSIYWMMKETNSIAMNTFDVDVYLTSEENNIDFDRMTRLYATYNNKSATYIFLILEEYRYDFSDFELAVCVSIEQDETYVSDKNYELTKTNDYNWYINRASGDLQIPVQEYSDIPENIMKYIQTGYLDYSTNLQKYY